MSINRALIIIPTMGSPDLIVRCVGRILMCRAGWSVNFVVVANPTDDGRELCEFSRHQIQCEVDAIQTIEQENANGLPALDVTLDWLDLPGPAGWIGAVNAGVEHAFDRFSVLPSKVVVMNDDALVTPGWLDHMAKAFDTDIIQLSSDPDFASRGVIGAGRSVTEFDKIGIVGPCTNLAAGMQQIQAPKLTMSNGAGFVTSSDSLLDSFASTYNEQNSGAVLACNFLSGFLMMYDHKCLTDLYNKKDNWLLDPCLGIGGHDDNDVCARAEMAGWRTAIALDVYVHHIGHQTLDEHFPEAMRGCANVGDYLTKWQSWTQRDQTMAALYRVRLTTMQDLMMFRDSIQRSATLLDGIAVLLTDNPAKVTGAYDYRTGVLSGADGAMIDQCASAKSAKEISKHVSAWINQAVGEVSNRKIGVAVDVWEGKWNERDERNRAIELAESLDTDWLMSVDHDEIVEDRITRDMVQRLMKHPDPMVQVYDIGWLNHWDTPRLCRVDSPWCGPDYSSSMRGFRIWKHNKKAPRRIVAGNEIGLHCGNSPDFGIVSKRVAGLRMRHFGYLRPADRARKFQMYSQLDPTPDADLTTGGVGSGGYQHLISEEGMRLSPYVQKDGIAYFMLIYKDDQAHGMASMLSHFYSLCDQMIIVWTGENKEPSPAIKAVGEAYGVTWVHQPFTSDLAECRNAAMDKIREHCDPNGISWALSMDDDEAFESPFSACVSIRRMAEVSNGFGWMFRFKNYRADGQWHWSETQRLIRVEPNKLVYFSGRVHETVEKSNRELLERGIMPNIRYAPFSVNHFGLAGDPESMQKKLMKYSRLLVDEIKHNPMEPAPWVSLGLQYGNDQMENEMEICFQRACELSGRAYLPWKELGTVQIRRGKRFFGEALARLAPAHPYYRPCQEIHKWLTTAFPEQPLSGNASKEHTAVPSDVNLNELLALRPKQPDPEPSPAADSGESIVVSADSAPRGTMGA